uniref:Uncharacterized protein n=1 Tax=Sus scrofa TaxID=9823 RepID=A0A8D1A2J3_PIG
MFILSIHEHSISFFSFVSSSVSFINVLQFSEHKSFTSLVKFITKYFTFYAVIVNDVVFLFSHCDRSLLGYKYATDLCVLILYFAALPNSLMSSNNFLVASLGFSMYSIMLSANSDSFTS